jgi:hypothetical protein
MQNNTPSTTFVARLRKQRHFILYIEIAFIADYCEENFTTLAYKHARTTHASIRSRDG